MTTPIYRCSGQIVYMKSAGLKFIGLSSWLTMFIKETAHHREMSGSDSMEQENSGHEMAFQRIAKIGINGGIGLGVSP